MQITFEAEHGCRILRRHWFGIAVHRRDDQPPLWWCYETRKWVDDTRKLKGNGSSMAPCHSYKAFLRHLRKHPELAGYDVEFVSRYVGFHIHATVGNPVTKETT